MDPLEIPDNISRDLADLVVAGREFDVGARRFKVRRVYRGSMADVDGEVIPLVRRSPDGSWLLGLYQDPEVDPRAPLLVAFELERVR